MARRQATRRQASRKPTGRAQRRTPGKWRDKGRFLHLYDPRQALKPAVKSGASAQDIAFEEALAFVLNTAYENGHFSPAGLRTAATMFRGSYAAWRQNAAPGTAWADVLFPNIARPANGLAQLPATTLFVTLPSATLLLAQTGEVLQESPALRGDQRSLGGFVLQGSVIAEVLIDLITILLAAFGLVSSSDKIERFVNRIILGNPRVAQIVKKIIEGLMSATSSVGPDDYINWLAELARILFSGGEFVEFLKDAFTGMSRWDILALLLGLIAILVPASAGVKIAYIIAQIGASAVHLHDKYEKYSSGKN